jgi:hypothetical protein
MCSGVVPTVVPEKLTEYDPAEHLGVEAINITASRRDTCNRWASRAS